VATRLRSQARLDTFPKVDRRVWAIYGRISKRDKNEGAGATVKIEDQLAQSRALVLRIAPGAQIVSFRDNKSAWDPGVVRDEFEAMVSMLQAGELAGIVCWHTDRLTRQMSQQITVWSALKATGAQLHTVRTGHISDPTMWHFEGLMNERSSDQASARLQAHHQRLAKAGRNSGGIRQFGFTSDKSAEVAREADAIRDAAARVLGGESLSSVIRDWTAKGIHPTGKSKTEGQPPKWASSNLSQMLCRPSLAGWRTHGTDEQGQPIIHLDEEGNPVRGQWPQILDQDTHEALVRMLRNPARRTSLDTAHKHLLSGVATCAACGSTLKAKKQPRGTPTIYACRTGRHCAKPLDLVDAVVVEAIVSRLARSDSDGVWRDDTAQEKADLLAVEKANLVGKLARLADQWADATTEQDEQRVEANQAKTQARLAEVDQALGQAVEAIKRPDAILKGLTGHGSEDLARAAWEACPVTRKRAVIRLLCEAITLTGSRAHIWDPTLVDVVWRQEG
jgi:site-specific DNA recombinase